MRKVDFNNVNVSRLFRMSARVALSLLTVAVFMATPGWVCSAVTNPKTVTHYKVSSMGLSIGNVVTTQRVSEEAGFNRIYFETKTSVQASFLWTGVQLTSTEKGTLSNGGLISYSRKGQEDGIAVDVEGRLENGGFRFDVREQGGMRTVSIPRSSYDYTTMECPEARLNFPDKAPVVLRILDVEKLAVVKREYSLVRNAHYAVAGKEHPCRIIDFSDQNKKARRWIAWDGSAIIMYRQDSRGEKPSYSVQATSVSREM